MYDKYRVVLADDHELFRDGVVNTLNLTDDIEVIGEASNVDDVLDLVDTLLPDVALLDVSMPGGGITAARKIATDYPLVRVAMLTVAETEDDLNAALDAGACGYLLKGIGGNDLIETVRKICGGETYITPSLATRLLTEARHRETSSNNAEELLSTLKFREDQILQRLAKGLSNKEIGLDLGISEKTVKHYMTNVLQKLQVRNRVEAALLAQRHLAGLRL